MAVVSGQAALNSSTATLLVPAADSAWLPQRDGVTAPTRDVAIINTNAQTVYLGDSSVTSSTGYQLVQNGTVKLKLYPDETISAIATSATPTISYVESGN